VKDRPKSYLNKEHDIHDPYGSKFWGYVEDYIAYFVENRRDTEVGGTPMTRSKTQHVSEEYIDSTWNAFKIAAKRGITFKENKKEKTITPIFSIELSQLWEYLSNNYACLSHAKEETPKLRHSKAKLRNRVLEWYRGNDLTPKQKELFIWLLDDIRYLASVFGKQDRKKKTMTLTRLKPLDQLASA
jgi:hypothetical protein